MNRDNFSHGVFVDASQPLEVSGDLEAVVNGGDRRKNCNGLDRWRA